MTNGIGANYGSDPKGSYDPTEFKALFEEDIPEGYEFADDFFSMVDTSGDAKATDLEIMNALDQQVEGDDGYGSISIEELKTAGVLVEKSETGGGNSNPQEGYPIESLVAILEPLRSNQDVPIDLAALKGHFELEEGATHLTDTHIRNFIDTMDSAGNAGPDGKVSTEEFQVFVDKLTSTGDSISDYGTDNTGSRLSFDDTVNYDFATLDSALKDANLLQDPYKLDQTKFNELATDGVLTKETFETIDTDASGDLSLDELKAEGIVVDSSIQPAPSQTPNTLTYPENANYNLADFQTALRDAGVLAETDMLDEATFNALAGADGKISKSELDTLTASYGTISLEELKANNLVVDGTPPVEPPAEETPAEETPAEETSSQTLARFGIPETDELAPLLMLLLELGVDLETYLQDYANSKGYTGTGTDNATS